MKKNLSILGLVLTLVAVGGYSASRALVLANSPAPAIAHDLPSYRDVVKKVLPAVVSIEAHAKTKVVSNFQTPFNFPGLPDELRKEFEKYQKKMPEFHPGHAFGSGFIVDPNGVILTNDHVIRGADEVEVLLQDGRKFTSRDIKRDPRTDLAIVRIQAKGLPFLKLGDSDAMEIGDRVLAIGAPLGMTGTVTSGIVSAKGRDIHMNMYEDFLQTDAAINPGNSGGPLVNLAGEVIGINSAIKSGTGGFQGIGLAISSNLAKNVMDQLQIKGAVQRGYLGVNIMPLDPEVAARLGLEGKTGVVIAKVGPRTPAAKAGLKDGDILTEFAGHAVKDARSLQRLVAGQTAGKEIKLTVYRDGHKKTMTLTVENQPETFGITSQSVEPGPATFGKIGVKLSDLTAAKAKELGFPEESRVLITDVDPASAAGRAGLRSGMLILQVDGRQVKTVADVQTAFDKSSLAKGYLLQVRSPQGGTMYVLVKSTR
jgi:serine protease Do